MNSSFLVLTKIKFIKKFAIEQQSLQSLMTDLNALDKARLISFGMPHASAWIWALPFGPNKLSCLEWQICMKIWLGIAIFENDFCVKFAKNNCWMTLDIMLWFVIALEIASQDTMLFKIASLMLVRQLPEVQ